MRIDSGYACIRRYISVQNRKAVRLVKKMTAVVYVRQDATVLSKGAPMGEEVEGTTFF